MRVRSVFLSAAFAMEVASPAFAQAPAPLSLRDALLEARRSNPELIALQRQADSVRAAVPASRFLDPPMVESQIWGWPATTLNPAKVDQYMFTGEQTLPGKGKRAARERVANDDARLSEAEIAIRANTIYGEIKQAYAELFLSRATADLFAQQTPLLRATTDVASIRYTAGQSGQHDTVKSLVELSRLGVDAIEWRERARIAEAELNFLMGRAPDSPIPPLASLESASTDAAEAERNALAGNPELAMARTAIEREEAELARVKGERRPDYVVGGGYMLQPGTAGAWTARAGVTWPNAPWSRGRLTTEITSQEKRVEAARAKRDALELTIRRSVREAAVKLEAARERVRLLETTVLPNITQAVDVATVAYQSNRGPYLDLLDSQRLLLITRMDLVAAQADVQAAAAALESAVGLGPEN
jgi:cobalt-zinc-cadmium efflux system outer membrane protein